MASTGDDGQPGRILLVEDDAVAAHFAMQVLGKRGGFDVTHTPDPAVALRHVSSAAWDLVLTDAELPGMTGLEFLEALRRLSPDLPIAVITAHGPAGMPCSPSARTRVTWRWARPEPCSRTAAPGMRSRC